MARGMLQFLSKEEIQRVHDTSMRVLREVGIIVHSDSAAKMLIDNGAEVSKDGRRILIDERMVRDALADAPKSLLLASRDGAHDVRIPDERMLRVSNGGEGVHITDLLTGETRDSTTEDLRDFTKLIDLLPQIDFCWGMVGALDQPADIKGVAEMEVILEATRKHFQGGASDADEARGMIGLASLVTGGEDALAERPIFSAVQCPISPLTFEKGLAEAQVEFARAGIPVVAMAAAVAGLTAPVTLAGCVTQVNVENLASLVITQTAKKEAPWIYSSDSAPGDLSTGSISYGALEAQLLRTGSGQMGRFYGLPTMAAGVGIESTSLQLSDIEDGVSHMILQGIVPSDLGSGLGGLDQASGAALEQLVADAWIWEVAREFLRDFSADAAAISFETIRDAGIDGNFLGKRHTLNRFKKEFAAATRKGTVLTGRNGHESKGALVRKANEEAHRLLRMPKEPAVTARECDSMRAFVKSLTR